MRIVTLTTDLGHRDPYLALVKVKLLSGAPHHCVELSTGLRENVSQAAFIVRNALPSFPEGTIHLVGIKYGGQSRLSSRAAADDSRFLLAELQGQFVITPDNGLLTLVDPSFSGSVFQLYYEDGGQHFFLRDVLAPAALHLLAGGDAASIGVPVSDYHRAMEFESFLTGNVLKGKGIYVDDFGNIVTNITREKFAKAANGRAFTITLPGERFTRISQTYDDVKHGAALVLFNSFDHLEVAANGASAFDLLCPRSVTGGFDFNLLIEFHD